MKRGLRTVVYDDTIPEEQSYESVMPSQAPATDNYMPEFPGMEDPSLRQVELADGGVVQREELKGGTALDKGNISVQSKRGSNVVYGLIFPGGKEQEETFYQAVRERYSNLKPKGEKYSANWFAKTFPISERQARRAIAYIRDKEKLQYREPLPTEKYLSNKRRREAIKKHGGIQTSPFQGTKKTNLSHLDDIYSQYIKGSNMGYAPRAINEKLGEADGIDFKIRALYEKRNKLLKENPKDIVKQLEDINLKGARLSGEAKGFKQFTLQDPITGKQSVIGGGKFTLDPTDQFKGMTERQIQDFILNADPNDFDDQLKIKLFQENRKASFEAAKKFPKEKIKTIVENIGCPTGALKAANGANCYIKGAEKIQAGKLNQNEFNVLQKAVKSPAVAKAVKYGGAALKGLGALFAPLMVYDTYTEYKKGKPISEALEYGLLGTNIIGGTRDELKLTSQEREARGVQQQYEREQQDVSGLSSDFYFPSDLSADQAAKIYEQGQDRVAAERAAEEKQAALENVYQGDPGILDYSEYAYGGRVGLAAGTIPKAVNWVAKRIQEINKLIKTRQAKAEDFLDEIQILNKAEELNLTKEQVGQILRQQKQAATEKYLKRPIEGDPDLESRLPYDPNATPRNIKRGNFEKGSDPKDKPILPINPMIGGEDPRGSLQDPGRRDVLKGMGLLGAGVAAGKLGLLKLGKAIKKAPLTNIVKPMGKTMTQFPTWFPTLMNRIRKEGTQIPIFKTKEVNISKQEYDALKQQGTKNLFDRYIGRTENYVNELKQQGIPRYYQKVNTDEIIGYQYEVKDLPNVRVTDLAGKEIRIDFPNAYGKDVTMTYKAPKVSVDMQGKKVKYDAEFQVDDAVPESGGYPGDVPDFYGEIVNNLDEVYGGASQIEQYALKLKKPRTTQGDEVVNAWDAGQPHMSVKEMRELELKKQKKQERRDYAKQQVDEKPATFEDREFLKNFLDAGDDID